MCTNTDSRSFGKGFEISRVPCVWVCTRGCMYVTLPAGGGWRGVGITIPVTTVCSRQHGPRGSNARAFWVFEVQTSLLCWVCTLLSRCTYDCIYPYSLGAHITHSIHNCTCMYRQNGRNGCTEAHISRLCLDNPRWMEAAQRFSTL